MMVEHNFQWSSVILAQRKVFQTKKRDFNTKGSLKIYFSKSTICDFFYLLAKKIDSIAEYILKITTFSHPSNLYNSSVTSLVFYFNYGTQLYISSCGVFQNISASWVYTYTFANRSHDDILAEHITIAFIFYAFWWAFAGRQRARSHSKPRH
jgi:hypothetical protein